MDKRKKFTLEFSISIYSRLVFFNVIHCYTNHYSCSRTGIINLDILPSDGDEEEKTFTVNLRSASNSVDIDTERQTVTITIAQRGMPYGTIGFFGDVLQPQKVNEGEENQTFVLPIARSSPALGNVEVTFVVTGMYIHTCTSY